MLSWHTARTRCGETSRDYTFKRGREGWGGLGQHEQEYFVGGEVVGSDKAIDFQAVHVLDDESGVEHSQRSLIPCD
jgi:hypothetical protein